MLIEKLDKPKHARKNFTCGDDSLDTFLKSQANQDQVRDISRTYVTCDDAGEIIGYYTLVLHSVKSSEAPERARVGSYDIPAVLLARLAVHSDHHGEGVGRRLLLDAFLRAVEASDLIGGRLLVVDALDDEAATYYKNVDMVPFESRPLRLYSLMTDVKETLAQLGVLEETIAT